MLGLGNSLNRGGTGPNLLLDLYSGAQSAYSLRKLSSTYTGNCIRVRRDDGTTEDIGFDGASINSAALEAFCGSANGFIDIWYDQGGSGNNATTAIDETTATKHLPQIVASGSYLGYAHFSTNHKEFSMYNVSGDATVFVVIQTDDDNAVIFDSKDSGSGYILVWADGSTSTGITHLTGTPKFYIDSALQSFSTRDSVHTAIADDAKKLLSVTDIDFAESGSIWTPMSFGDYDGGLDLTAKIYEMIVYNSDKSSHRVAIDADIMNYHGI